MLKQISSLSMPLVAAVALVGLSAAQSGQPNLAGTYRCGPDAKACEWSGSANMFVEPSVIEGLREANSNKHDLAKVRVGLALPRARGRCQGQ